MVQRRRTLGRALALAVLAAVAPLGGCAGLTAMDAPVRPPQGFIFVHIKAPLTTDFEGDPAGEAARKVSRSQTTFFRDFIFTGGTFGWDEAAIARIAREGGIQTVSFADYEVLDILGVYGKFTVTVYGR